MGAPSVQGFSDRDNNFSVGLRQGYHQFKGPQVTNASAVQGASGKRTHNYRPFGFTVSLVQVKSSVLNLSKISSSFSTQILRFK